MKKKLCVECGIEIPQKRLQILPETETCVKCSNIEVPSYKLVGASPSLAETRGYQEGGIKIPPHDKAMLDAKEDSE